MSIVVLASGFRDSLFGETWAIGNKRVEKLDCKFEKGMNPTASGAEGHEGRGGVRALGLKLATIVLRHWIQKRFCRGGPCTCKARNSLADSS